MYINVNTLEYPLLPADIIVANPNVSFPSPFEPTDDYAEVQPTLPPEFNEQTHRLQEGEPVFDGEWHQNWDVVVLTQSELDARAAAAAQALIDAKAAKHAEINEARLAANNSVFPFAGKFIVCDKLSRSDIDGVSSELALTGQLPADFPGGWKTQDNTYVAIPDVPTWITFVQAMVATGTANFGRAQLRKAAIDAATTLEQVAAITW